MKPEWTRFNGGQPAKKMRVWNLHRPTSRNHYNPCFWVALWNDAYFREWQSTSSPPDRHAREQSVWVLNLRSDRIYESKVEGVHFQKGLGVAEISPESMLDWCKHWYPGEVAGLAEYLRHDPDPLYLDFEPTLHGLEQLHGYRSPHRPARKHLFRTLLSPVLHPDENASSGGRSTSTRKRAVYRLAARV
jgi:hypothetical protein